MEQQRGALRAGVGEHRAGHVEPCAAVLDAADFLRVHPHSRVGIGDDGVVLHGVLEQLVHHLHELIRPVVTLIVRDLSGHAEVAGGRVLVAGHDVPGDAALGEVVQGREPAGQQVGLLVGDARSDSEAQMLGDRRQGRHDDLQIQQRVLHTAAGRGMVTGPVDVVDPGHIGQEEAGESGVFEGACQLGPVLEGVVFGDAGLRVSPEPGGLMDRHQHVEGVEVHRHFFSFASPIALSPSGSVPLIS